MPSDRRVLTEVIQKSTLPIKKDKYVILEYCEEIA